MYKEVIVVKKDGTEEIFDPQKLRDSLERSGAKETTIVDILKHVEDEIRDGVTTTWIYRHAYSILEKHKEEGAARYRYSLRRAVSELGPSGFPFERFIAEVFSSHGYKTQVGKRIKGKCVTHEVDVVAETKSELITAELKFHNKLSIKTDLKVVLYVNSRFNDIKDTGFYGSKEARPMLITNTKFTSNSIAYAECEKTLELMGWDYPRRGKTNLHDFIQSSKIHPVTALSSFSKKDHQILIDAKFVTCKDIKKNGGADVHRLGLIKGEKVEKALEEIELICIDK